MLTIHTIQSKMRLFDNYATKVIDNKHPEQALQDKWETLFKTSMSPEAATSFTKYYRSMRSKISSRKTQSGGSAPLNYNMTPGINTAVYGKFPVAVDTDMNSIKNLDVYFQNSLTKGCGIENSSLSITEGMGSNMVGGSKKRNTRKMNRKVNRKADRKSSRKADRKSSRKANRKSSRKANRRGQRGGLADISNLGASLYSRPYLASAPVNTFQSLGASVTGSTSPVPVSSSPTAHTWGYVSNGIVGTINPSNITKIGDSFESLASPAPWQTQN